LQRVLENLLDNAIRHAPARSAVHLVATGRDEHVEIRVSDSGPGIPAELRERIFERFVQVEHGERGTTRAGRGLGLTFCKLAVLAHGGSIHVEDLAPGAAFCVRLARA
jgi:signal transduction histidine kinase